MPSRSRAENQATSGRVSLSDTIMVLKKKGGAPIKYKELMALAVAFTTQCPYCIEIHSGKARLAAATDPEIAEVVTIAAALRAGAAITHGTHAFPGA
jgi:AhpD family alkylhydroperoxidase